MPLMTASSSAHICETTIGARGQQCKCNQRGTHQVVDFGSEVALRAILITAREVRLVVGGRIKTPTFQYGKSPSHIGVPALCIGVLGLPPPA